MAAALKINDMLSHNRNEGLTVDHVLPNGRLVGAKDVGHIFPQVDSERLKGGAVWYDAVMTDDRLLAKAALSWAMAKGAVAKEGIDVRQVQTKAGRVVGVQARSKGDKSSQFFESQVVINATGPWAASFAGNYDKNGDSFFAPSLAWNIVFRRPPLSSHALALTACPHATRTYFAVPWQGQLMIGTGHAPWQGALDEPQLANGQIDQFLSELNRIVPTLQLAPSDIKQKFVGLLPAQQSGSDVPSRRPVIIDHGMQGGPAGLHSVSGVKFTTARAVADKTLSRVFKLAMSKPYDDLGQGAALGGRARSLNFNSA
jgi:glycerol-3-phosphate dehydrogenase